MAGSVNKVLLLGNLGKDPEIRSMSNGNRVATFSIATSERWKDKQTGERKDKTEWHNIVIFNDGLVTVAEKYLRKGSKVFLEGQLQTRKWQDKDGNDRYSTEIVLQNFRGELVMLGDPQEDRNERPARDPERKPIVEYYKPSQAVSNGRNPVDDDIPFAH